jgi:hypothetical protein
MWTPSGTYQQFYSLTDVVAMDCEMVGVGQGNKSALGRVTLVFISSSLCIYYSFVFKLLSSLRLVTCLTYITHSWKWFHLTYTLFWLSFIHCLGHWKRFPQSIRWLYICWLSLFVGTLLRVLQVNFYVIFFYGIEWILLWVKMQKHMEIYERESIKAIFCILQHWWLWYSNLTSVSC